MADAVYVRGASEERLTAGAAVAVGEVWQMTSGEAAVFVRIAEGGEQAASTGEQVDFRTNGKWTVTKTTGIVFLAGQEVFWDFSANAATFRAVNDRDFFIGCAVDDAGSSDATLQVDLNKKPSYDIDISRDAFSTTIVGTQGFNTMGIFRRGGAHEFLVSSTSEAQKMDILSVAGFDIDDKPIIDFAFRVLSDGAGTVVDVSVGMANATDSDNADDITDSVFMHLNANDVNIYFESDDGTTEVAATDSTVDYTEGAALANRVHVMIDARDKAAVKMYVNGVRVLAATTFDISASVATWFLLAHIEKSSAADTYQFALDWLRKRGSEQG